MTWWGGGLGGDLLFEYLIKTEPLKYSHPHSLLPNPSRVPLMRGNIIKAGRCHKGFAIIYIRSVTCIISLEQAFMTSTGAICHVIVIIVIILIV